MSLPYFPMYPTDFEAKTSHLTLAEDGAYNRLLRICWMTPSCTMPADEAWIMRRARAVSDHEQEAVRVVLAEFFTIENGRYSNARLRREWLAANEAHERRKNAGAKGGKAKSLQAKEKTPSKAKAMPKQPEPEPELDIKRDTNVSLALVAPKSKPHDLFAEFWDRYPKRIGKADAHKAYARAMKKITHDDLMFALSERLPALTAKDKQYRPNPATWLNQERWTDEIDTGSDTGRSRAGGTGNAMVDAFAAVAAARIARNAGH